MLLTVTFKCSIMNEWMVYNDHTILSTGRWRGYALHTIPARYFLNIYSNHKSFADKALVAYIEKNLERIQAKHAGLPYIPEVEPVALLQCTKKQFPTQKAARDALKKIRELPGDHKKPIRSYECPVCSAWHHTSMPIQEWKRQQEEQKRSQ